MTSFLPDDQER